MASRSAQVALVVAGGLSLACADYSAVADVHSKNQEFLYTYEVLLCLSDAGETRTFVDKGSQLEWEAREKLLTEKLAEMKRNGKKCSLPSELKSDARAERRANREIAYAKARLEARNLSDPLEKLLLAAETERIHRGYTQQAGVRGRTLEALQAKLIESIRALRNNGHEVQEYLELSWWQRLFAESEGADEEKLRAIGKDLEGLKDRAEALVGAGG